MKILCVFCDSVFISIHFFTFIIRFIIWNKHLHNKMKDDTLSG